MNEWCASEEDCQPGLACLLVRGEGLFGPYAENVCVYPTGEAGEPCASLSMSQSGMPLCAAGTSCVFGRHARVAVGETTLEDVGPEGTGIGEGGGIFWADTRESEGYQKFSYGECVPDGTLAAGETCSGRDSCSAGLVCHRGYEPNQCHPPSALAGPCTTTSDCATGTCLPSDLTPLDEDASATCARADPACDIRRDASCNHWLACGQCR